MKEYIFYARELIKEAEGFSPVVYKCPAGFNTIGYGRNIDANPLTQSEIARMGRRTINGESQLVISNLLAEEWLTSEILDIASKCEGKEWFEYIGYERKGVIIDIIYNIGFSKWNDFEKCKKALADKNFGIASYELGVGTGEGGKSKYFLATGNRALRNIEILKYGEKIQNYYKGAKK